MKTRGDRRPAGHLRRAPVKIAAAGNKPRVDAAAAFAFRSLSFTTLSASGRSWNAAIFATVPLFDGWRTKGRVAQARSAFTTASITEQKLRDGIAVQVRTALDAVQEAAEILSALSGTEKQAERLLFLSEKGYELGVKTRLEVQDAEQNLRLARANVAAAQRDYQVSLVNLDWVTGALDARAGAILEWTGRVPA